jgi:hypothetical protein
MPVLSLNVTFSPAAITGFSETNKLTINADGPNPAEKFPNRRKKRTSSPPSIHVG